MSTSCYVPGCEQPIAQEDCCTPHSLINYRQVCGHLISKDPSRPCVRAVGHAVGSQHRDIRQYRHNLKREADRNGYSGNRHEDTVVPNDGVIDPIAIDLTVEGVRKVRLTWVEREIAAAILLARGEDDATVETRTNIAMYRDNVRNERIREMADYIRKEGYDAYH